MSLVAILTLVVSSTLVYSAPLIFTSIGGTFSERSGVVNVGLEGIMGMGAFASVVFNLTFANTFGTLTPWFGLVAGAIVGLAFHSYMQWRRSLCELITLFLVLLLI